MRLAAIGLAVTTDQGRFDGRTGTIIDFGAPGEVWVRWLEPSAIGGAPFKTLAIESVNDLIPAN